MEDAIRILILEDADTDAAIIEEELSEGGLVFELRRATGKEDYLLELDRFCPDLILSDYNLPQYDGAQALQAARAKCPEVPFILVTGAIGEELAIAMFIHGANDYVMKGKLQRLVPAVRRTLAEAAEIKARKRAEEALRKAHDELEITVQRRTAELQQEIAVRRRAEETIRVERSFLRKVIDTVPSTIFVKDSQGRYLLVNEAMARFFGTTVEQMVGRGDGEFHFLLPPGLTQASGEEWGAKESGEEGAETVIMGADGQCHWFTMVKVPLSDESGAPGQELFVATDITTRKRAENLLRQSEEKLRLALDAAQQGTWDWDLLTDEAIWSDKCKALFGLPPETRIDDERFLGIIHPEDRERIVQAVRYALETRTDYDVEMRGIWPDGTVHWLAMKGRGFYDGEGRAVRMSGMAWDITLRKRYEEEIQTLSNTDELTGLYNRRGFMTLAEQELKRAERTKRGLLFIYADLDGLKVINDTFGHQRGDEALVEAAGILRDVFRESDIIARIGGDEFALLVSETPTVYAGMVKTRLQRRIERRNAFANRPFAISMCVGVSHYDPLAPVSLDELISRADAEMYEHKKELSGGRGSTILQEDGHFSMAL